MTLDLTTPGHTSHKKKAPASTPAAAHGLDPAATGCWASMHTPAAAYSDDNGAAASGRSSAQHAAPAEAGPCAEPCLGTASRQQDGSSRSKATPAHAASAAKTPAAVRPGVKTPAVAAILTQAFSVSPYAPTPVPYGSGQKPPGGINSSGAGAMSTAGAEPRRTRAKSSAAAGNSGKGSTAAPEAAAAASSAGATHRRTSGRGGGMSGTPVPKFSLTSPPSMLPPASRTTLNTASSVVPQQLQLQPAATPAQASGSGRGAAGAAAVTPATAPRSAHAALPAGGIGSAQASSSVLRRWSSAQSAGGAAAAAASTPRDLSGLPNLLDLLAAASAGECGSSQRPAGGQHTRTGLAAAASAASDDAMQVELSLYEAADLMATAAVGDPGAAGSDQDDATPKESTLGTEQRGLPAAALATPAPQVVKALAGTATAEPAGAAAASCTPAGATTLPGSGGSGGRAHSGDSAGSVGGSAVGASGGGSAGACNRAVSAMRLKKLWRESHAAAMAAAAAAATKPDQHTATEAAAAAAAAGEDPATPAGPRVVNLLSHSEPAGRSGKKSGTGAQASRERSPDTLAVACSADLLLLAAAAEDGDAAMADADVAAAAASAAAQQAQVARAARDAAADPAGASPPAATAAAQGVGCVRVPASKARRSSNGPGPSQQPTKLAAARAAVSAAMPRQPHAAPAAAAAAQQHQQQRRHHLDGNVLLPQLPAGRTAHVPAAAAAEGPAGQGMVSNCGNSLMLPPAAQMRLLQLQQQQGAPAASSRLHPMTVSAANARVPHVLNPGQMPPPRTSHTGASLSSMQGSLPAAAQGLAGHALSPRGVMTGPRGAVGAQQQQQARGSTETGCHGAPATAAAAEAAAAAARAAACGGGWGAAAALHSLCSVGGGGSEGARPGAAALEIAPLNIPELLSDADSWRLAQAQPWLLEAVAAEARQLLLGASAAAAAAGGVNAIVQQVNQMAAAMRKQQEHQQQLGAVGHSCSGVVRGPTGAGAVEGAAKHQQTGNKGTAGRAVLQPRN